MSFTSKLIIFILILIIQFSSHADTFDGTNLHIDTLEFSGEVKYQNVVITPGTILTNNLSQSPSGMYTIFNTQTQQLYLPQVWGNSGRVFINTNMTIGQVISIGSGTGIDTFDGTNLTLASVVVGSTTYRNPVVTIGKILSVAGGIPNAIQDNYDPSTNTLSIPAVQYGNNVYTNVKISLGSIISVPTTPSITIPSDITKVNYPSSYTSTSASPTIDDTCILNLQNITYPAIYQGAYPLPSLPIGQTLSNIPLGISPTDNWMSAAITTGATNANLNLNCTNSLRNGFTETLTRIKTLGASYVMVYQWNLPNNVQNPTTFVGTNLSDDDIVWMAQQAHAAGLQIRLMLEANPCDLLNTCQTPADETSQWYNNYFQIWTNFVQHEAQLAESAGYYSMALNWTGGWEPNQDNPAISSLVYSNFATLSNKIRTVFSGKLEWVDWYLNDMPSSFLNSFDFVSTIINTPNNLSSSSPINVQSLKNGYSNFFGGIKYRYGSKPIELVIMRESYSGSSIQGYLSIASTNSPPYYGPVLGYACIDCNLTALPNTDFSEQAIGYEAILELVHDNPMGLNFESVNPIGYWYTDTLTSTYQQGLPNLAESIRNKPAEAIVYNWWKK